MRLGFVTMALLAALVALYSFRFVGVLNGVWVGVDPGIREVIVADPVGALGHMLIAPVALLLGPFQFIPRLRDSHRAIHRWTGRVYVAACVISGSAGLITAFHASGGPVAGWGFGVLAVLWIAATVSGWWAATQRQFDLHRLLMRFSYAMTFGAVTLRLQIPIGFMLGYSSYSAMSVWLAYTAWIPNVLVVALYTLWDRRNTTGVRPAEIASRLLFRPARRGLPPPFMAPSLSLAATRPKRNPPSRAAGSAVPAPTRDAGCRRS